MKQKLREEIFELALQNEMTWFGCTQAVLAALQEKFNMENKEVFKAATALAGGAAGMGETCGALTGALMAVGQVVGRDKPEDVEQLQKAMAVGGRVYNQFREEVGHTICHEIHKIRYGRVFRFDIPEEMEEFEKAGGHSREGCPEVCGIGARIAAEVILDVKEGS